MQMTVKKVLLTAVLSHSRTRVLASTRLSTAVLNQSSCSKLVRLHMYSCSIRSSTKATQGSKLLQLQRILPRQLLARSRSASRVYSWVVDLILQPYELVITYQDSQYMYQIQIQQYCYSSMLRLPVATRQVLAFQLVDLPVATHVLDLATRT